MAFKRQTPILDLADSVIATVTAHYPADAKESAAWLAAFTRERCNGNIPALVIRAQRAGFDKDYTYFHRVLTGKYFMPDPESKTGKIIGSVNNFVQIVERLRAQESTEFRTGRPPFIETETFDLISAYIDKKRLPERINRFGAVVGWTGTQKTACFREYALRNNHGRVVHIEAPEKPRLSLLIGQLAHCYGESASASASRKLLRVMSSIHEGKCIIIDNIQRLYIPNTRNDQPLFNFIQKLQDESGCTVIMSYTPDFTNILSYGQARGYFEQFVGRMGGLGKALVLPEYPTREDVLTIAKAFKLEEAAKHIKYLEKISREPGRIRALFDDLQDAATEAKSANETLTVAHLHDVRGDLHKEAA